MRFLRRFPNKLFSCLGTIGNLDEKQFSSRRKLRRKSLSASVTNFESFSLLFPSPAFLSAFRSPSISTVSGRERLRVRIRSAIWKRKAQVEITALARFGISPSDPRLAPMPGADACPDRREWPWKNREWWQKNDSGNGRAGKANFNIAPETISFWYQSVNIFFLGTRLNNWTGHQNIGMRRGPGRDAWGRDEGWRRRKLRRKTRKWQRIKELKSKYKTELLRVCVNNPMASMLLPFQPKRNILLLPLQSNFVPGFVRNYV